MHAKRILPALLISFLHASLAHAGPAEDRAAADALFQDARALAQQGNFAEACLKFAGSQTFDPKPGRLLALGDCYEQKGDTASAWATFREAAATAREANDDAREKEALRRAGLLEPNLAKLVVNVAPEARVAGLEVRRNGKPIEEAIWGSAFPVDPGEQAIEATAPGKERWARTVGIGAEAGVTSVEVPRLVDVPVIEKPVVVEREPGKSLPIIVAGAVLGIVGIGTGIGLIVAGEGEKTAAFTLRDSMPEAVCNNLHPEHGAYTAQCAELKNKLVKTDTLHNVGVGVAIVGGVIAAGTVVYALWPKKKSATMGLGVLPVVAPTFAGLSAAGRF